MQYGADDSVSKTMISRLSNNGHAIEANAPVQNTAKMAAAVGGWSKTTGGGTGTEGGHGGTPRCLRILPFQIFRPAAREFTFLTVAFFDRTGLIRFVGAGNGTMTPSLRMTT